MKKTILLFALVVFGVSSSLMAQEYWNYGVKGGVNFSNMSSDGFEENNSRTGFNLGFFAEIPVSDRISIQPEVLYATQGTEATGVFAGQSYKGEYQLDYVQVPLIAKFYVVDGLAIEAGPSFNFLAQEEYEFDNGVSEIEMDSDLANTFEFGGAVGASYKFNNGFLISGRYTQGFTDVYDDNNWGDDAIKNNGVQLGVGFVF